MGQSVPRSHALQPRQRKYRSRAGAHMSGSFSDDFEHVNNAPEIGFVGKQFLC